jgi:hypothetical protein
MKGTPYVCQDLVGVSWKAEVSSLLLGLSHPRFREKITMQGGDSFPYLHFPLAGTTIATDSRSTNMFSDLLVFKTPKLQRAQMVLALLQLALKKANLIDDAKRLEGLDLTNPEMAKVALEILNAMNVAAKEVPQVHTMAIEAIRDALQPAAALPAN